MRNFIYSTYNGLLEGGWRMREIDEMDMIGFLKIRAWNAKRKAKKPEPVRKTIDSVWPQSGHNKEWLFKS